MSRQLLQECLPGIASLAVACIALFVVLRLFGARLNLRRLADLHRCERGGVQSLALVLTLPLFIHIVVFIVQTSQLLIAHVVVNYASFAAARAASVWVAAETYDSRTGFLDEASNRLDDDVVVRHPGDTGRDPSNARSDISYVTIVDTTSNKLEHIRTAAVLACVPISPSRVLPADGTPLQASPRVALAADVAKTVYEQLLDTRSHIDRKAAFADNNTLVVLEWRDTADNTVDGPTYNPITQPSEHPHQFDERQVGWQDAMNVYVIHRYALFTPAPWLRMGGVRHLGTLPPWVLDALEEEQWIVRDPGSGSWVATRAAGDVETTFVIGSAAVTNEGLVPIEPVGRPIPES